MTEAINGSNGHGYTNDSDRMEALAKFRSASSINMSPELFEKLYLNPQSKVKGELRKTFGNPTPVYDGLRPYLRCDSSTDISSVALLASSWH